MGALSCSYIGYFGAFACRLSDKFIVSAATLNHNYMKYEILAKTENYSVAAAANAVLPFFAVIGTLTNAIWRSSNGNSGQSTPAHANKLMMLIQCCNTAAA